MKSLRKRILAMASMVALSGLMMASVAGAADKLMVMDPTGATQVFKVTDQGVVGAYAMDNSTTPPTPLAKLGVGTLAPASTLTVVDEKAGGSRGLAVGEYESTTNAAMLVFRKSRGNYAVPGIVSQNDYVGAFHGQAWDGASWQTDATINYFIDGPVSTGVVPMSLLLSTGSTGSVGTNPKTARVNIGSNGKISMGYGTTPATISGTGVLHMHADTVRLDTPRTPATGSACNTGEISWDDSYVYVCTSTGWKRSGLTAY